MSCPTCDHTMQSLRNVIFWCPRCGTISDGADGGIFERPKLVDRCREFGKTLTEWATVEPPLASALGTWKVRGIAESINKPEDRRPT